MATLSQALAGLGRAIVVETGIWTLWPPIGVIVCPGAIWDGGSSIWDGAEDVYDNNGAIWDPASPFGGSTPPAAAGWVSRQSGAGAWSEPLR
jgi:hypothetical protein